MYRMTPKKTNHVDTVLLWSCIAFSVIFLIGSAQEWMPLPWLAQLLGFCCAAGALSIATFRLAGTFLYVIEPSGIVHADGREEMDFAVYRCRGGEKRVQARISLESIAQISRLHRGERYNAATKGVRVQCLYPDLFPSSRMAIKSVAPDGSTDCILVLAYDSALYDLLSSFVDRQSEHAENGRTDDF